MQLNFIKRLTLLIGLGVENLNQSLRKNVCDYIWSQQQKDGGFAGRKGSGEIYYTSFALRTLALLGELSDNERVQNVFHFLNFYFHNVHETNAFKQSVPFSGVDLTSFQYAAQLLEWTINKDIFKLNSLNKKDFVRNVWKQYERPDGGFVSSLNSSHSSVYQSFLAGISLQLNDWTFSCEQGDKLKTFLLKQQRNDGGFADLAVLRNSGTNPTVAALGLLEIIENAFDNDHNQRKEETQKTSFLKSTAIQYLISQQMADGGFRAHLKMPCADLLSSFSAFLALAMFYGKKTRSLIDCNSLNNYVDSLYCSSGSFRGGIWDHETDVEYTFYGIALKSMLATIIQSN